MSHLTLVRHGQAAAFSADSDRLTELGDRQAQLLGEYLVKHQVVVTDVVTGGLKRQKQTEQWVAVAYEKAGFQADGPVMDTQWGPILPMSVWTDVIP